MKCIVCGGELMEIRGKLICKKCYSINAVCCEGKPPFPPVRQ